MNAEQETPSAAGRVQSWIKRAIAWALHLRVVRAFLRYSENNGAVLADSITYRALFSVFAAILLGFSIAGIWLQGNPEALEALSEALETVIPGIGAVVSPESIPPVSGFTIVGIVSLLGLVGAAMGAIGRLRTALLIIADEVRDDTFFLWTLLRQLLVGIAFALLLITAAAASVMASVWIGTVSEWLGLSANGSTWFVRSVGILLVFVIDTVAVLVVFRLLSGISAPPRALWTGAMLGGAGLTVLQELSGLFVRGATSNPLLASFAALIALLLWFNLSAQVILIASSYIVTATADAKDRVHSTFGASTFAQRRRLRAEEAVQAATRELRAAQEAERQEREKETPSPAGEKR